MYILFLEANLLQHSMSVQPTWPPRYIVTHKPYIPGGVDGLKSAATSRSLVIRGYENMYCSGVALKFFRALKTFQFTFLRMRDKCKIINVQRKDKSIYGINITGCSLGCV